RQRIATEERLPEFIEDTLRTGQIPDGLLDILALVPKATLQYVTNRFSNCGFREDCELLGRVVHGLGEEAVQRLIETLQSAPANEATEVIGLLSQLSPEAVERILPARLAQWPRTSHDRAVRQLSATPAEQRGRLLAMLYDSLDPLIRPLALDEMGMSLRQECIGKVVELTQDEVTPGFTRIKAIVSVGVADCGGTGVAENRANGGDGKDIVKRAGPEGTGDGADRPRAQCSSNPAAAVRTVETVAARYCRDHQLARQHPPDDPGIEHERRNWGSGPASGARLVVDAEDFPWRTQHPRASHRAGRASAGHGVRVCGYGSG